MTVNRAFGPHLRRPGCALLMITGLALAGCTATAPMQPYSPPPANVWNPPPYTYSNGGYYAPPTRSYGPVSPSPSISVPQHTFSFVPQAEARPAVGANEAPLPPREVDPPYSVQIDPACGWWRLCNLWQ